MSGSSSSPPPMAPPEEDAWIQSYHKLLPHCRTLTLNLSHQSAIPISISRVNQFDAARLDIEMSAMLKEQLVKVFSLMKPGMLFQYEPELDAFLEFLIWRFSIWVDKPTPGNALINLRYSDERAVEPREKGKKEMLLLLLPLLNLSSVKNLLSPFSKEKSSSFKEVDGTCPICLATPTTTFLALPCHHRCCYY